MTFQCRVDTPRGIDPLARRVAWDRDEDVSRLTLPATRRRSLEPTISQVEAPLEEATLNRFVKEATTLSLPFRSLVNPYVCECQPEFGLEGFDVEGRDGRPIVRVEWSMEISPAVQGIADWSRRMREWFEKVIPAK